jgi:hypothetical protein
MTPRKDWVTTAVMGAVIAGLFVAVSIPAVRALAVRRRGASRVAGWIAIALSVAIIPGMLAFPDLDVSVGGAASASLFLAGFLILRLPSIASETQKATEAREAIQDAALAPSVFNPVAEVRRSLGTLIADGGALSRVAGPWLAAYAVIPLVFVVAPGYWSGLLKHRDLAAPLLLGLLVLMLLSVCSLLVAAIQWTRYLGAGREPAVSEFPANVLWSWFWRLIVAASVLSSTNRIGPWLTAQLPGATPWLVSGLADVARLGVFTLAAPYALGLPIIALQSPASVAKVRAASMAGVGRKLYLGFALVLAPYFIATRALEAASSGTTGVGQVAMSYLQAPLLMVVVMIGITYLTRVAMRSSALLAAAEF